MFVMVGKCVCTTTLNNISTLHYRRAVHYTTLQQYTTPLHYTTTPLHYTTTPLHYTTPLHHYTTPLHHATTIHHYTTPLHHYTTPLHCTTTLHHYTTPLHHATRLHTHSRHREIKLTKSGSEHLSTELRSLVPGLRFLPLLLVMQRGKPLESVGRRVIIIIINKLTTRHDNLKNI